MIVNGTYTPKDMDMSEFDKAVDRLRGKVVAKSVPKRKVDCTPSEWAANLDYQKYRGRAWRRKVKQRRARAAAKQATQPAAAKLAAPKAKPAKSQSAIAVLAGCAIDTNSPVLLGVAKNMAGDNADVVGLLALIEQLMS
jgi:hypothetical protein